MDNGAQSVGRGGTTEMLKLCVVNYSVMDVSLNVIQKYMTQFVFLLSIISSALAKLLASLFG